jgi:hypothetical protein
MARVQHNAAIVEAAWQAELEAARQQAPHATALLGPARLQSEERSSTTVMPLEDAAPDLAVKDAPTQTQEPVPASSPWTAADAPPPQTQGWAPAVTRRRGE